MPDMKEVFSSRLKRARIQKGITQAELSRLASLTPATVSAYEKGQKLPNLSSTAELAKALDVTIDWLCGTENSLAGNKNGIFETNLTFEDFAQTVAKLGNNYSSAIEINYWSPGKVAEDNAKIVFKQKEMIEFVSGFKRLKELYQDEVLTKELFETGVNGLIDKYKDIPVKTKR